MIGRLLVALRSQSLGRILWMPPSSSRGSCGSQPHCECGECKNVASVRVQNQVGSWSKRKKSNGIGWCQLRSWAATPSHKQRYSCEQLLRHCGRRSKEKGDARMTRITSHARQGSIFRIPDCLSRMIFITRPSALALLQTPGEEHSSCQGCEVPWLSTPFDQTIRPLICWRPHHHTWP